MKGKGVFLTIVGAVGIIVGIIVRRELSAVLKAYDDEYLSSYPGGKDDPHVYHRRDEERPKVRYGGVDS